MTCALHVCMLLNSLEVRLYWRKLVYSYLFFYLLIQRASSNFLLQLRSPEVLITLDENTDSKRKKAMTWDAIFLLDIILLTCLKQGNPHPCGTQYKCSILTMQIMCAHKHFLKKGLFVLLQLNFCNDTHYSRVLDDKRMTQSRHIKGQQHRVAKKILVKILKVSQLKTFLLSLSRKQIFQL